MDFGWTKTMFNDLNGHSFSTKIIFILITIATLIYFLRMIIPLIYAIIDTFKELFAFKKRHRYKSLVKKGMKKQKKTIEDNFEKGRTDSKDFKKSYSKTN